MKRAIFWNLTLYTRNLISPHIPKPNCNPTFTPIGSSTRPRLRFFSSESDSSSKPNFNHKQQPNGYVEVGDVASDQELKKRIEKFYEGDEDEIPAIFEAILKRKLAGISDDDGFMESLGPKANDLDSDDELHDSDSDSDSDNGR